MSSIVSSNAAGGQDGPVGGERGKVGFGLSGGESPFGQAADSLTVVLCRREPSVFQADDPVRGVPGVSENPLHGLVGKSRFIGQTLLDAAKPAKLGEEPRRLLIIGRLPREFGNLLKLAEGHITMLEKMPAHVEPGMEVLVVGSPKEREAV